MTLHEAIIIVLTKAGKPLTTHEIAAELNRNGLYSKKDKSEITDFQIHGRTKESGSYSHLFSRNGSMVSLKKKGKV